MLRQRLFSAFIIISCSFGFVALDAYLPVGNSHGVWMTLLACFLFFGSALECSWMLKSRHPAFERAPGLIGCAGVMLATAVPMLVAAMRWKYPADCPLGTFGLTAAATMIALVACFFWHMPKYSPGTFALERSIVSGWLAAYFGIGFAFWVALRQTGSNGWGLALVVGLIVVTKFTDAGAYFTGRALGKRKLCPAVSPGKTLEGLIGGMIVGVVVSLIYFGPFMSWLFSSLPPQTTLDPGSTTPTQANPSWLGAILLGIVLTFAGLVGDLLESVVKRETEFKDSSHALPGLGGLWDVTDSLLPAGVAGYLVVAAGLLREPV